MISMKLSVRAEDFLNASGQITIFLVLMLLYIIIVILRFMTGPFQVGHFDFSFIKRSGT